jgi:hypothetical protein
VSVLGRIPWLALLLMLCVVPADACQICIPKPERTLADHLLAADAVVLAREDPERPFHYRAAETLKGVDDDPAIDRFLNSRARRVLAASPKRAMVLARQPADGSWSALGITDPELDRVVRGILAADGRWRPRETDNAERLDWFAPLLGHSDARLHELAYLEIGRAPYAQIRRLAPGLPREQLQRMLDDPRYLEWRRLAILMLGESTRAEDRERVRAAVTRQARSADILDLAAWATALIAVDGVAGLDRLADLYAADPGRERRELEEVIQALSVHARADAGLRDRVAEIYGVVLETHPGLAPTLVHDLIAWRRWDFAARIREARATLDEDPLARYALGLYLRLAKDDGAAATLAPEPTP